ncbi:hypothetical protein [Agromyces allii]|uniref:hypothetical protein n=1 Tax=Agromyces allii TaxID=393607 RepID=UPI0012FA3D83|nr:hypothetical protein [Agromyces allii]
MGRWLLLIASVVAIIPLALFVFPPAPPGPPPVGLGFFHIVGNVKAIEYRVQGPRHAVVLTVGADVEELSFSLNTSLVMRIVPSSDIPDVWSGNNLTDDACWSIYQTASRWPVLERSQDSECANSNEIRLSWPAHNLGTAGPYAWSYSPPTFISVDRRVIVDGKFEELPERSPVIMTTAYSLDLDELRLSYLLKTRDAFSLRKATLFPSSGSTCVSKDTSSVVSNWDCAITGTQDTAIESEIDFSVPASYAVWERTGYQEEKEAMLLVLGALLGLVGGGIYAELQALDRDREARSRDPRRQPRTQR